jgi:hypothetical protein
MALITFKLTDATGHYLAPPPFSPYKRRHPLLPFTAPPPLISPLHLSSSTTAVEFPLCHSFSAIARSPHRCPSPGQARDGFPAFTSLFCALAGKLTCSRVAGGQTPVSTPPCPGFLLSAPQPVHGGRAESIIRRPGP